MTSDAVTPGPRLCPLCRKPAVEAFRPFCSKRCADVDLSRWLKGVYAVPTDEGPDDAQGPVDGRESGEG